MTDRSKLLRLEDGVFRDTDLTQDRLVVGNIRIEGAIDSLDGYVA